MLTSRICACAGWTETRGLCFLDMAEVPQQLTDWLQTHLEALGVDDSTIADYVGGILVMSDDDSSPEEKTDDLTEFLAGFIEVHVTSL